MRRTTSTTRKLLSTVFAVTLVGALVPTSRAAADSTPGMPDVLDTQSTELVNGESVEISRDGTTSWTAASAGTLNTVTLSDAGLYRLTAEGAGGGGTYFGDYGGAGGITAAVTPLDAQTVYAVPGGRGVDGQRGEGLNVETAGGANGGGNGGAGALSGGLGPCSAGGSGGGASHIALAWGSLAEVLSGGDDNLLIAAGGGGGGGRMGVGGIGGGASGEVGHGDNGEPYLGPEIPAGTQTSGYQKGVGQDGGTGTYNVNYGCEGRGGAGGGYWGGTASTATGAHRDASGAGGSGFLSETNIDGTKTEDGDAITKGEATVATTALGTNTGGGSVSIEYLASIVTLDAGDGVATTGTTTLFSAPDDDAYYRAYSTSGLQDAVASITIPTRTEGIRYFAGYYTGADRGGTRFVDPDGTIEAGLYEQGSTTLYAAWGIKVSFDSSGVAAEMPQTQTVDRGERATKPADPTAPSGLEFKGWSSDPVTYTEVSFDSTTFDEDTTLYAFWTPQVSFEMNGHGEAVVPQFLVQGSHVVEPVAPTEEGHTFLGWFKDSALTEEWNFETDTTGTTNMTLYAKWAANKYTVRYLDNGVSKGVSQHTYGIEKNLTTAAELGLSREGWTFAGWRAGSELKVDRNELMSVIDRVSLIVSEKNTSPVRMTLGDGVIDCLCVTPIGRAEDVCTCEGSGGELVIGFNDRYMKDALKAAPADELKLCVNTASSPCILKAADGSEGFTFMVLPVRLHA